MIDEMRMGIFKGIFMSLAYNNNRINWRRGPMPWLNGTCIVVYWNQMWTMEGTMLNVSWIQTEWWGKIIPVFKQRFIFGFLAKPKEIDHPNSFPLFNEWLSAPNWMWPNSVEAWTTHHNNVYSHKLRNVISLSRQTSKFNRYDSLMKRSENIRKRNVNER